MYSHNRFTPAKYYVPSTLLAAIGMRNGAKYMAESRRPPAARLRDPALRLRILPHFHAGLIPTAARMSRRIRACNLPQSRQLLKAVPVCKPVLLRHFQEFVRLAIGEMPSEPALGACESYEMHRFSGFWIG